MNRLDHVRTAAARLLDYVRGEQQRQYHREQSQPNGLVRQMDDPDRQVQEQQARAQREQQQAQERAQRDAVQRGDL